MRGSRNGRLDLYACVLACVLARFTPEVIRRSLWILLLMLTGAFVGPVYAQSGICAEESAAIAKCPSANDNNGYYCRHNPVVVYPHWEVEYWNGSRSGGYAANGICASPPPPPYNPCSGISNQGPYVGSGVYTQGMSFCQSVPDPNDPGVNASCQVNVIPQGPPIKGPDGFFRSTITSGPSGSLCDGSHGSGLTDSTGAPVPPDKAPVPVPPAAGEPPAPKDCGGSTCYDPNTGDFGMSGTGVGTGDASVPAPKSGSDPGSCATAGNAAICAGSPDAPAPPKATIPDPGKAATGHDNYTGADLVTGAPYTIGVGTYQTGAPTVGSGAKSTDISPSNPASSGAAGGVGNSDKDKNGNSASGGTDCNNPPQCSGDAILCLSLAQEYQTKCALTYVPASASSTIGDLPASASSVFSDSPETGTGVAGTGLDMSSWLPHTCPQFPIIEVANTELNLNNQALCDLLTLAGYLIIVGAGIKSFRIIAE